MDDKFVRTNLVPHSLRKRAIELCESANLPRLVASVKKAKTLSLQVFFSIKTHKESSPFRAIVSERHTWQQPVGRFIQKALSALEIEDPFLVFRPSDDLYYSLPQDELIEVVSEGIDRYGTVQFQNEVGVDVSTFLAVLRLYLQSTTVEFLGGVYLQRAGVCIGSCVAPVLSNLLLARYDRRLERALRDMGVRRVFRFVDDYLIIFDTENVAVDERTEHITRIFQRTLSPFTLTRELPVEHRLRFLDLELAIEPDHLCWIYAPRSKKGLLPFSSAHSKLVKRSIALSAMENAVKRSCPHQVQRSLLSQVLRLKTAGFPVQLIRGLAEVLLRKLHKKHEEAPRHDRSSRIAAIPYIHAVSHNIKKVAQRAGVSLVFTAPNKLGGLCRRVNSEAAGSGCNKKHVRHFVQCKCNVIYDIPLTCGKSYVGQTGRCLSYRLREHSSSLQTHTGSNLATHCRDCACRPRLEDTRVLRSYSDRLAREIYEGAQIHNRGEKCVSKPSVDLLNKETSYLLECS
ncbi:uncharacterized protein LOC135367487 [Ornithodoros turicata]|uniref:uncharacterized protein LOC135367487 n=1 Tax=Ornithodoros turicata TaxID=34597 RepID=UPI00313A1E9B